MSLPDASRELDAFRLRMALDPSAIPGRAVCVCMHEEFVFLGLDSGLVVVYAIEARRQGMREEDRKLNEVTRKKVSRKAITRLAIIDPRSSFSQAYGEQLTAQHQPNPLLTEQALLFVLADGRLLGLHPHTLNLAVDFVQLKEVNLFAVDLLPPHHLIVHSKLKRNKLQLVSYSTHPTLDPAKSKHDMVRELSITDLPLTLHYKGDWICVAYRTRYILLHSTSGDVKELPVPLEGVCPGMLLMSADEMLLTSNTDVGLFVGFKGEPLPRNPVDWGGSPFEMSQVDHYVIGLFTETPYTPNTEEKAAVPVERKQVPQSTAAAQFTSIRVASLLDQRIVQTVPFPQPLTCTSNRDKAMVINEMGYLFALSIVSLEEQIQQYMELSRPDEALALLQRTQPDTVKLLEFQVQAGLTMLKDLQLVSAFSHFLQSNVDPRELISLFNDLVVPERPPYERKHRIGNIDEVIEKGRRKAEQRSEDKRYKQVLGMTSKQIQRQSRLLLAGFLWHRREKGKLWDDDDIPWVETVLLFLCIEFQDDDTVLQPGSAAAHAAPSPPPVKPGQPTPLSTTIFPYTLQQLLFPSNQIIQSEAETFLIVKHRYTALASYYQSIHQPRKALEVWVRMGNGEFVDSDAGKADAKVDDGVESTVRMLVQLGDDPLLWEFAEWVLLKEKEAGLSIFTSDERRVQLPHEKVLGYLKRVNAKRGKKEEDLDIVESYLEHIVMSGKITDPIYHTQLVTSYLKKILAMMQQQQTQTQAGAGEGGEKKKKKKKAVVVLVNRSKPGSEPAPLGPLRRKLYRFLQTSTYYDAESVLSQLLEWTWPMEERRAERRAEAEKRGEEEVKEEEEGLLLPLPRTIARTELPLIEEMILLYAKLKKDEKVLRLFIFGLRDHQGAAQYCLHVAKETAKVQAVELHERVVRESRERKAKREAEEATTLASRPPPQVRKPSRREEKTVDEEEEEEPEDDEDLMDEDLDEDQLRARHKRKRLRAQREQLRLEREEQERKAKEEAEREEQRLKALADSSQAEKAAAAAARSAEDSGSGSEQPHPGDVFLHLILLYFSDDFYSLFATAEEQSHQEQNPDDPEPPPTAYQYAVDVMTVYHPYIDPVKAIKAIPPYVPIPPLAPLFARLIPRTLHARRHVQVIKSLAKTHHLATGEEFEAVRCRGLLVQSNAKCAWCKKLLGESIIVGRPVREGQPDYQLAVKAVRGGEEAEERKSKAGEEEEELAYVLVHHHCSHVYDSEWQKRLTEASKGLYAHKK